jgi:replication factor C subunit 3/5
VERLLHGLLNSDFAAAHRALAGLQQKGLALQDLVGELHLFLLRARLPAAEKGFLLDQLAQLEVRLASGASETVQMGGLVGAFQIVRARLTPP